MSQNLAIGYLAGFLEKEGHRVRIIDALAEGMDHIVDVETRWGKVKRAGLPYEEIACRIPEETGIIGITAPFTHHAIIVRELAAILKKACPYATIIIGGIYPSTLPEKALSPGVDYIIKGEGEIPIAAIAAGEDPLTIKGVWFRDENGEVVGNGTAEMVRQMDNIPFPARHLLPMEKYHRISGRGRLGKRSATIITSRGCPFNCTFCSVHAVYGWKWRARSPLNIISELKLLRDCFDIQHIEFEDDNLTLDIRRAGEIFDAMAGMGLTWSCSNGIRIDRLDRDLLMKIKKSGCTVLNLGIEHGDPEMLEIMNKNLDLKKVEEVISICIDLELPTVGFWVICHPGETRERFERGLEFFKKLKDRGMYGFGVHLAWPMPGTRLFDLCEKNGWLTSPDIEESLIFPGSFYIECPEFDAREALLRLEHARSVLDVKEGIQANRTVFAKARSAMAAMTLGYRIFSVNPAYLRDHDLKWFYPRETTPQGRVFRWSMPRSSVTIKPVRSGVKKVIMCMQSIADKQMTILANNIVIYDGRIHTGENELSIETGNIGSVNGHITLEFVTLPTIPSEIDPVSKDLRELGVIIWWIRLR